MSGQTKILTATIGEASDNERLDRALALAFEEISRTRIKRLIQKGQVTLDGATIVEPSMRVKQGQSCFVDVPPSVPARPVGQAMAGVPMCKMRALMG